MNSRSNLIGLILVLKHCLQLALSLAAEQEDNLLNDSSSRVRPEVSGKKKKINTSSKTSQQQYTRSHFQAMCARPTGFT